jgi:hypothetical protein
VFNLCLYAPNAERQKSGDSLLRIRIRDTLDKLVDGANSVGSYVVARIIKDEVQDQIE